MTDILLNDAVYFVAVFVIVVCVILNQRNTRKNLASYTQANERLIASNEMTRAQSARIADALEAIRDVIIKKNL